MAADGEDTEFQPTLSKKAHPNPELEQKILQSALDEARRKDSKIDFTKVTGEEIDILLQEIDEEEVWCQSTLF